MGFLGGSNFRPDWRIGNLVALELHWRHPKSRSKESPALRSPLDGYKTHTKSEAEYGELFKQQPFEKDAGMTSPSKGLSFFHKKTNHHWSIRHPKPTSKTRGFFFRKIRCRQASPPRLRRKLFRSLWELWDMIRLMDKILHHQG